VYYKFSFVFVFNVEQGRSVKILIYSSNPNNPSANWRLGLWGNFNTKDNSKKFDFWIKFGIEKDFEKIL
jgi:hypothetical protein